MTAGDEQRVSVSLATLKQLFAEFKLELVQELQKYATTAAHDALEGRVKLLELWQATVSGGGIQRDRTSRAALAWAALAVAALTALATVIWLRHG